MTGRRVRYRCRECGAEFYVLDHQVVRAGQVVHRCEEPVYCGHREPVEGCEGCHGEVRTGVAERV